MQLKERRGCRKLTLYYSGPERSASFSPLPQIHGKLSSFKRILTSFKRILLIIDQKDGLRNDKLIFNALMKLRKAEDARRFDFLQKLITI